MLSPAFRVNATVRIAIYAALALALTALDPQPVENVVASAAAILLECLPYVCASAVAAPLLRGRAAAWIAYAGCGCGSGASARSIPAAIATALLFGAPVALGRVALATLAAVRGRGDATHCHERTLADDIVALAPSALLAALAATIAPDLDLAARPLVAQLLGGAILGVFASPCALGGVALAASLHAASPAAAYAVLCTAGIVDMRRLLPRVRAYGGDAGAYVLIAIACAIAGFDGGARLVNPRLCVALFACVPFLAIAAYRVRDSRNVVARTLAAALVVAVVLGAPPPTYRATETTLAQAFPGEAIDFTGQYALGARGAIVERYAITCCRADAAPVALALARALPLRDDAWVRVRGTIAIAGDRTVLRTNAYRAIAPPRDPFIYR